ncbi:MAG: tRNA 2-thiouridine(34) synthase MnmA, partial [Alphaproteobacteria bacterium]|nr:tRNA 2-thiouridine(34) synthase MnmA [Alphaproteobacteria bacterium]
MARVVVAMSGGVDSSVAAALLVEEGHEVIGVHMKLHDADPDSAGHCCGLDDALDARRVADTLGIAFHVMDLREAFRRAVMDDLTETYVAGATPNPCVQCNGVLKFRVLLQRALALGATQLVTGHYAQIRDGALLRAADPDKDQSYFLFPLTPKALALSRFPLGGLRKAEVRAHAQRLGLVTADKPESQEICFIPDQDHAGFIARERPELDGSGDIVDPAGRVVGRHDGYWRFTVGQRRGLGVAMGRKVYVSAIDPASREVLIDSEDALWHGGLVAHRWVWHERPAPQERVQARIRHRGGLIPCTVGEGEAPQLRFEEPAWAVAPGQAVVVYRGDRVLGGGWIRRATDPTRQLEK